MTGVGRRGLRALGVAAAAGWAARAWPAAAQAPAAPAAGASTWEAMRARGTVRVGVTPSEPWFSRDLATGGWTGVGALLGRRLAEDMALRPDYVETTWANAPAGLQANQFDIMFVLDPTPARALAIDFPFAPVLYYALGFMAHDGLQASRWSDLDRPDVTIAVPQGTAMDRWVSANLTKASVTRLATVDQAILHFQSGHARVLVLYHPALVAYRLKVGSGTVVVPRPVVSAVAGAGVRREADKTWRDYLSSVLGYYYENGTTEGIYRAYLAGRGLGGGDAPGITRDALERG